MSLKMENKELIVILDNAGCKEDYPDFKDKSKTHSPRTKALAAINQHIYKEVVGLIGEDELVSFTYIVDKASSAIDEQKIIDRVVFRNELRAELRAAAKKKWRQE